MTLAVKLFIQQISICMECIKTIIVKLKTCFCWQAEYWWHACFRFSKTNCFSTQILLFVFKQSKKLGLALKCSINFVRLEMRICRWLFWYWNCLKFFALWVVTDQGQSLVKCVCFGTKMFYEFCPISNAYLKIISSGIFSSNQTYSVIIF
jgi:hypothetical protein